MTKKITAQGIFNHVYKFILKQGEASRDDYGTCVYRGTSEDGKILACAAGCLLTDKEAAGLDSDEDGEGDVNWNHLTKVGRTPERFKEFTGLITACQRAHDRSAECALRGDFRETFKDKMKRVSRSYGLQIPKV